MELVKKGIATTCPATSWGAKHWELEWGHPARSLEGGVSDVGDSHPEERQAEPCPRGGKGGPCPEDPDSQPTWDSRVFSSYLPSVFWGVGKSWKIRGKRQSCLRECPPTSESWLVEQ